MYLHSVYCKTEYKKMEVGFYIFNGMKNVFQKLDKSEIAVRNITENSKLTIKNNK